MRIALVHDWMTNPGGAERVLRAFHEIWPEAPIYTSVCKREAFPDFSDADIRTSFIEHLPLAKRLHQAFPLIRILAFEGLDLSDYDVVLSSCHAESKSVVTGPQTLHICYCHTPIRYYWSGYHDYLNNPRYGVFNLPVKAVMPPLVSYLRVWDRAAADRVDSFISNSHYVKTRIEKYYRRTAHVIHPPVDTSWLEPRNDIGDFFLVVGRLVPYKRADIVVDAFNDLGWPLKIVGTGSELAKLKARAGSNIQFLGRVSDTELREYYARCRALIFPQVEDFGITPLEAMAAGRPVIAFRAGGALETVLENKTGIFFDEQNAESLKGALASFASREFDGGDIRRHAESFDKEIFKVKIRDFVEESWHSFRNVDGLIGDRRSG